MRTSIAGAVGLSLVILLARHREVLVLDTVPAKVEQINRREWPLEEMGLAEYLRNRLLRLRVTLDAQEACSGADYIIVATSTDYDHVTHCFNTMSVEAVIRQAMSINPQAVIVIKSTVPVGYTSRMRAMLGCEQLVFFPNSCARGARCMTASTPAVSSWASVRHADRPSPIRFGRPRCARMYRCC